LFRKTAGASVAIVFLLSLFPSQKLFEWRGDARSRNGAKPSLIERTGAKRKRDSAQHQEMVCSSLT
jgi:hypothetical protein